MYKNMTEKEMEYATRKAEKGRTCSNCSNEMKLIARTKWYCPKCQDTHYEN